MEFKAYVGTRAFFGINSLQNNKLEIRGLGKRAFIVTGGTSGRSSGALADVEAVLNEFEISYHIYDKIPNNPSLNDVAKAAMEARSNGADLIVGIGGGSPLDAAKAVAILAINDIEPIELYRMDYPNGRLPIVAIPTTAGTGSEVTPYTVLTREDLQSKLSFGNDFTYPDIAFVDPKYTYSLPWEETVNTGIDAFTHALEGFLSKRCSSYSDMMAREAIKSFGLALDGLLNKEITPEIREYLMYVSMMAGFVISHTGTTIMHGLGYNLTYFKGVPHGKANVYFLREYLKFNSPVVGDKINEMLRLLDCGGTKAYTIDSFCDDIDKLYKHEITITEAEVEIFAKTTLQQRSCLINPVPVNQEEFAKIIRNSLKVV